MNFGKHWPRLILAGFVFISYLNYLVDVVNAQYDISFYDGLLGGLILLAIVFLKRTKLFLFILGAVIVGYYSGLFNISLITRSGYLLLGSSEIPIGNLRVHFVSVLYLVVFYCNIVKKREM